MPGTVESGGAPRRPTRSLTIVMDAFAMMFDWASLTRSEKLRIAGLVGILGAALASVGELGLLAAAEGDTEVDLVRAGLLGVFAIPLYAFGYWQVSAVLSPAAPRLALWLLISGAWAGAVGAAIHGMTAAGIAAGGVLPGASQLDPGALVPYLDSSWTAAAVAVAVASFCFGFTVAAEPTPYPRWTIILAPLGSALLIALLAFPFEIGHTRILPAAPHLAHGLFFTLSTAIVWRARPR